MAWVKWGKICTPKKEGGLGIKNIEAFNIALLTKWRWRILTEEGSPLWKEILSVRYGLKGRWPNANKFRRGWGKTSLWWRDLCRLGDGTNLCSEWFNEMVQLKLGRGNLVQFWSDKWLGRVAFVELFPSLYNACRVKNVAVEDMGVWVGDEWRWNWDWAQELLPNESHNLNHMQDTLLPVTPIAGVSDRWCWLLDGIAGFSVKKCYSWLSISLTGDAGAISSSLSAVWPKLWRQNVPSKVQIFAWRVLLDRIATRDALFRKGVLRSQEDRRCVFCSTEDETVPHLFLHFPTVTLVWKLVLRWLDVAQVEEDDLAAHFCIFWQVAKRKEDETGKTTYMDGGYLEHLGGAEQSDFQRGGCFNSKYGDGCKR